MGVYIRLALGVLLFVFSAAASANCGSAFCLVNSHWETQGVWTEPGWRVDLRYETIDQDVAWFGDHRATAAERTFDPGRTRNRNLIVGLDYSFSSRLGISLRLPRVDMKNVIQLGGPGLNERSEYQAVGDAETTLRYALLPGHHATTGLLLGMKWPTGGTERRGNAIYQNDTALTGPLSPIARPLQPGTGALEGAIGVYHHRKVGADISLHAQAVWRATLRDHDGYHPGRRVALDGGVSWHALEDITLSLQLAVNDRKPDTGPNAEPKSANTVVALSPGIAYDLTPDTRAYIFYQHPLYRRTDGLQAVADGSWVVGVSQRF